MTAIQNHCRKYLPHIEVKMTQFVTYRLYDSLPHEVIISLKSYLEHSESCHTSKQQEEQRNKAMMKMIDKYEDAGYGQCFLQNDNIAQIVADNLKKHDGTMYDLYEWCIMPNHVHVLIHKYDNYSLSQILHSWRSYTASKCNELLKRKGQFWMPEYFDRYIRDEKHATKTINYILNNPVRAGLVDSPEQWRWSSARNPD